MARHVRKKERPAADGVASGDARRRAAAERLRIALALNGDGIALKRMALRRRHPGAPPAEIDRLFSEWLLDRPLDAPGQPVKWPRPRKRR